MPSGRRGKPGKIRSCVLPFSFFLSALDSQLTHLALSFPPLQAVPGADLPSLYQAYIAWELKPKKPDAHLVQNLYARAIAEEAAKGPYEAEPFWVSLITFLVSWLPIF